MLIVCRPQPDADATVARLREKGTQAEARPLIERCVLAEVRWPDTTDLVFVTSTFAAGLVVRALSDGALGGGGKRPRIAALARATAPVFEAAGHRVDIKAHGGAVGLANAVYATGFRGRVLYPVSLAAPNEPEHHAALAVLRPVADVRVLPAYDTRTVANARALIDSAPGAATWWFHSPSAVRAFLEYAASPPHAVRVSGASTLRAWQELKPRTWPDAHLEEAP